MIHIEPRTSVMLKQALYYTPLYNVIYHIFMVGEWMGVPEERERERADMKNKKAGYFYK